MAEMTTLLAAVYREYTTREQERQKGSSPAITSRFEVFYDENFSKFTVRRGESAVAIGSLTDTHPGTCVPH